MSAKTVNAEAVACGGGGDHTRTSSAGRSDKMAQSGRPLYDLLSIADAARLLGFRGMSSVRSLIARGELAVAFRGAHYQAFFDRQTILALMERRAAIYAQQRSDRLRGANDEKTWTPDEVSGDHRSREWTVSTSRVHRRSEEAGEGSRSGQDSESGEHQRSGGEE